jgi:TolB-like protein
MTYKGTTKTVAEIARELGVDFILEGSVRRESDRVRIVAQLVRASGQTHI